MPRKVVVIDDSRTMQRWLGSVIAQEPQLQLVGTAGSAQEARAVIKATNPDVITLDIEMPGMNGLDFLHHVMRLRPMPVVMLSSQVTRDGAFARRALAMGAAACVTKPDTPTASTMRDICAAILRAATGESGTRPQDPGSGGLILVGASTGGVPALEAFFAQMPANAPPIVVAQHMPQNFLARFARRLDSILDQRVDIAHAGGAIASGDIRFAPAQDMQTGIRWQNGTWQTTHLPRAETQPHCPSVDVLFGSAAPWARYVGAVLLTGLGADGAQGMLQLRQAGARTLGQNADSCVVYGMPGAAAALGASEQEAPIEHAGTRILDAMRAGAARGATA